MTESIEQIISTTIFLILILLLRAIFYNRISKRACYAMWLVVGIYLLASFGEFSNSYQILNVIYRATGARNGSEMRKQEQNDPQPDVDYGIQEAAEADLNVNGVWDKVQNRGQGNDMDNAVPTTISDAGQENKGQEREKLAGELWIRELRAEGV